MVSLDGFKLSKIFLNQVKINLCREGLTWDVVDIFPNSFKFWREHLTAICRRHPKGNQGWRNGQFFKGTRHGVLTTDRWQAKLNLCFNRT
ncbi:Uncharacterised protein [Streptococcus pneumoniae]|nr:Uncharacterised protein [Streptococcus pneumoniae]